MHDPAEEVQFRRVDRARRRVVGEPLHTREHPVEEELRCKRGDSEIEALDTETRNAEQDADKGRHQTAEQDRRQNRQRRNLQRHDLDAGAELVGAIGADRHEGAAAERKLAAIAGEDVEADGSERQDQERDEDRANEILAAERPDVEVRHHRHANEDEGEQHPQRDPILTDREHLHVRGVAGLELSGLTIEHCLHSLDDAFAEQPLRAEHQDGKRQHVSEPVFDAAADRRPEIGLRELFARADDEPAPDRAGHRGETADDEHRQRLEREERDRELHAELGAPYGRGDERDEAGDEPDDEPDPRDRNANRLRGGMIVGDRTQCAAGLGALEEHGETRDKHAGDQPAPDVELVHQDATGEKALAEEPCVGREQAERIDLRAEDHLRDAFKHEGDADGGHEQRQSVLIDQRSEHKAFDDPGRDRHDDCGEAQSQDDRGPDREALRDEEVERAHEREACEQHHRALREVEHAGCLEDQHEPERDQRIEHAGQETAEQDFEELTEGDHAVALQRADNAGGCASPPPVSEANGGEGSGVGGSENAKPPTPAHCVRRPSPPLRGGRVKAAAPMLKEEREPISAPLRDTRRSPPGSSSPRPACHQRSSRRGPAPPRGPRGPSPRPCRARSARWSFRNSRSRR